MAEKKIVAAEQPVPRLRIYISFLLITVLFPSLFRLVQWLGLDPFLALVLFGALGFCLIRLYPKFLDKRWPNWRDGDVEVLSSFFNSPIEKGYKLSRIWVIIASIVGFFPGIFLFLLLFARFEPGPGFAILFAVQSFALMVCVLWLYRRITWALGVWKKV